MSKRKMDYIPWELPKITGEDKKALLADVKALK